MTLHDAAWRAVPGQHAEELLNELLSVPIIRPAAVARGRARLASSERCPADDVASRLVEDLMGRRPAPLPR
jgi:hypothetical protein